MRKLSTAANEESPPPQLVLARELEVENAHELSARELVVAIESRLGDRAALEYTRWFIMSVLRHEQKANWNDPDQSGLSRDTQYELASLCLSAPEFAQSIKTVLKGDTCKYALVEFGRSRKPRRHKLSNSTVAYQHAVALVRNGVKLESSLLDGVATISEPLSHKTQSPQKRTFNSRRASRRGFSADPKQHIETDATLAESSSQNTEILQTEIENPAVNEVQLNHSRGLSQHEIAELDLALSRNPPRSSRHYSLFQFSDEESRSWLLGMLAGFATFGAILILFF